MVRFFALAALTAAACSFQPIVDRELGGGSHRPDLLLVPLLVAVLASPGPWAVFWSGVVGLVGDCLAGPQLGPRMAAFALLAAVLSWTLPRRRLLAWEVGFFGFGLALGAGMASSAIGRILEDRPAVVADLAHDAAGRGLATSFLVGGVWIVFRQAGRFMRRDRSVTTSTVAIGWQRRAD